MACMRPVSALYLPCPDTVLLCIQASDQDLDGGNLGAPQDVGPRRARGSKSNLLQGLGRQSSAVNLTTLPRDSDLKRLVEEVGLHRHANIYIEWSQWHHLVFHMIHSTRSKPSPSCLLLLLLLLWLLLACDTLCVLQNTILVSRTCSAAAVA